MLLQLLALVLVGSVPTLSRGTDWLGSWKMALNAGLFSLTLVGPASAGIACAVYTRFATSGTEHLVLTGSRPWRAWLRPAAATWSLGAAAVLAITLATTSAAQAAGSANYPETFWVALPALCVLAAQVAVGVVIGAVGRRRWLAPLAATVTFGLGVLGAVGAIPDIFRAYVVTGTYAGESYVVSTHVLQAGAALGVVAALLALSHRAVLRDSSWVPRVLVGALVVAGGACYFTLGHGHHASTRLSADPPLVCHGAAVRVCLAEETTRPLDDLVRRMERQAVALHDLGLTLPARYVDDLAGTRDERDGGVPLLVDETLADTVSDETAARVLSTPARCAAYSADVPPPEASFAARRLLARWLLVRAGRWEPDPDDSDRAWLESDLDEQRQWVTTTYERLRACDLQSLRLPSGV